MKGGPKQGEDRVTLWISVLADVFQTFLIRLKKLCLEKSVTHVREYNAQKTPCREVFFSTTHTPNSLISKCWETTCTSRATKFTNVHGTQLSGSTKIRPL